MFSTENRTTHTTNCSSSAPYLIHSYGGTHCHLSSMVEFPIHILFFTLGICIVGCTILGYFLTRELLKKALQNNSRITLTRISQAATLTTLGIEGYSAYLAYSPFYISAKSLQKHDVEKCVPDVVNYDACISDRATRDATIWLLLLILAMSVVTCLLTPVFVFEIVSYYQNPVESFQRDWQAIQSVAKKCIFWNRNNSVALELGTESELGTEIELGTESELDDTESELDDTESELNTGMGYMPISVEI